MWIGEPARSPKTRNKICEKNSLERKKGGSSGGGVSAESSVAPKKTKTTQGYWSQQSERHSQERRTFLQKPPSKHPLFFVPEIDQK